MTSNYTKVANVCNLARPKLFENTQTYIEEAVSQAIEDVDADYLETIMDAFDDKTIDDLGGIENVKNLVEHWKNKVMLNALKEFSQILTTVRIHNWDRKVKLDEDYYEEMKQL